MRTGRFAAGIGQEISGPVHMAWTAWCAPPAPAICHSASAERGASSSRSDTRASRPEPGSLIRIRRVIMARIIAATREAPAAIRGQFMQTLMAIADSYLLPGALWLVMFTIGLSLKPRDFAAILSGRRSFVLGLISMLVLVPACGIL